MRVTIEQATSISSLIAVRDRAAQLQNLFAERTIRAESQTGALLRKLEQTYGSDWEALLRKGLAILEERYGPDWEALHKAGDLHQEQSPEPDLTRDDGLTELDEGQPIPAPDESDEIEF